MFRSHILRQFSFVLAALTLALTQVPARPAQAGIGDWFAEKKAQLAQMWEEHGAPAVAEASTALGEAKDGIVAWANETWSDTPDGKKLSTGQYITKTATGIAQAVGGAVETLAGEALGGGAALVAAGSDLAGSLSDGKYQLDDDTMAALHSATETGVGMALHGAEVMSEGGKNMLGVARSATGKYFLPGVGEGKSFAETIDDLPRSWDHAQRGGEYLVNGGFEDLADYAMDAASETADQALAAAAELADQQFGQDLPEDQRMSLGEGTQRGLHGVVQLVGGALEATGGTLLASGATMVAGASEIVGGMTDGEYQIDPALLDGLIRQGTTAVVNARHQLNAGGRNILDVARSSSGKYLLPDVDGGGESLAESIDALGERWNADEKIANQFVDDVTPAASELLTAGTQLTAGAVETVTGSVVGSVAIITAGASSMVGDATGYEIPEAYLNDMWAQGLTMMSQGGESIVNGGQNLIETAREVSGKDFLTSVEDGPTLREWGKNLTETWGPYYRSNRVDIEITRTIVGGAYDSALDKASEVIEDVTVVVETQVIDCMNSK